MGRGRQVSAAEDPDENLDQNDENRTGVGDEPNPVVGYPAEPAGVTMGVGVGYKRFMPQQDPQSTPRRSRSWIAWTIAALVVIVAVLALTCPKPKPVPASIPTPASPQVTPDAPQQHDDGQV